MTDNKLHDAWNLATEHLPTNDLCEKEITIDIVGDRCIYLNDYRIVGGKPYISERLPTKQRTLKLRSALEAFSIEELQAYIKEKIEREAFYHGMRSFRDGVQNDTE